MSSLASGFFLLFRDGIAFFGVAERTAHKTASFALVVSVRRRGSALHAFAHNIFVAALLQKKIRCNHGLWSGAILRQRLRKRLARWSLLLWAASESGAACHRPTHLYVAQRKGALPAICVQRAAAQHCDAVLAQSGQRTVATVRAAASYCPSKLPAGQYPKSTCATLSVRRRTHFALQLCCSAQIK